MEHHLSQGRLISLSVRAFIPRRCRYRGIEPLVFIDAFGGNIASARRGDSSTSTSKCGNRLKVDTVVASLALAPPTIRVSRPRNRIPSRRGLASDVLHRSRVMIQYSRFEDPEKTRND